MTRPFLKWAGGKYKILPLLKKYLPPGKRLIEPFVGAGAVFLNTEYEHYLLADTNRDLINLYQTFQTQKHLFINYCKTFFTAEKNNEEIFYSFRDKFNTTDDVYLRSALFLYLNRHGFNGLCRYNANGKFNVPFGRHCKPFFPEESMKFFLEKVTKAKFLQQDFVATMLSAKKGDVIYCDPPYAPLSKTANFSSYSEQRFTIEQQILLANTANKVAQSGIKILISNHDTPWTRELYQNAKIISFKVSRVISSKVTLREPVQELIAVFGDDEASVEHLSK